MLLGEASAPEGMRLYAIGDIHGCLTQLLDMFAAIEADLAANPIDHYAIVTVGDYVDRGPDSRGVLDCLIEKGKSLPLTCLRGNHDQRMLEFMDIPEEVGESFLAYGGRDLLASYGIDAGPGEDLSWLSRAFKRAVPEGHIRFLDELPLTCEAGDYFLCHAGIKPGVALDDQEPVDLLWIRKEFLTFQGAHPKVIIHGHTPRDEVDIQPNRINVDTQCFGTGMLSCIVLEGREHRLLQVHGPSHW